MVDTHNASEEAQKNIITVYVVEISVVGFGKYNTSAIV